MPKSLEELLAAPEANTPYPPLDAGRYVLKAEAARYTASYEREDDGVAREVSPKVRLHLRVVPDDGSIGRSAFVTVFVDQDGNTFGFVKGLYRKLAGNGLLDSFTSDVTNDEIAQQFAAGVVGGTFEARLGVRTNTYTSDQENIITRMY